MTTGTSEGGFGARLRSAAPLLRAVVSALMLIVLLRRVHLRSLFTQWDSHAVVDLAAAIAVTLVGVVLSAVRWQRVLTALEAPAGLVALVVHTFAGLFVSNFLPSTIGGDVLRVTRLSAANGKRPTTFASVVLERLSGWIVLPVITLVGLTVNPSLRGLGAASHVAEAISVGTLVLLGVVLISAASPRVGGRLGHSEGWRRFVAAVHLGLVRFREHPAAAVEVLVAGFVYQLAVVLAAFLAAAALGMDVGWTAMLAFMPAVAIVQVLPVTIGGLGVREGAFVLFLHPLGVATHEAIALGVLVYGVNLVASLAGAPAFATGGGRVRQRTMA
ncbi:MAG: glycosyltransferase 2 family protein [Acidimicrobiaceae bacterium]|nr:glycosyltransferase 2 family protein [Acidimicrobiaceae bacterium]